jgi:ribosomal protein S18 acetylase RimI-like enzyme
VRIEGPIMSGGALDELRPLWQELHRHHLNVAQYRRLVDDLEGSWERRRSWYRDLLAHGGAAFFVARDDNGPVGYAMTRTVRGPDDTFEVRGGIVEIITLVVTQSRRTHGIGTELVVAVREFAVDQAIDTVKVAVMVGNTGAKSFYADVGFEPAEEVLYLELEEVVPGSSNRAGPHP